MNYNFINIFNAVADLGDVTKFENGTGYFDTLCQVDVGTDVMRFTDRHGRSGLVLPIVAGCNIIIFQRYVGGEILVSNTPGVSCIAPMLGLNGAVSDDTVGALAGPVNHRKVGNRQPTVAGFARSLAKLGSQVEG